MTAEEIEIILNVNYDKVKPALDKAKKLVDSIANNSPTELISSSAYDKATIGALKATKANQVLLDKIRDLETQYKDYMSTSKAFDSSLGRSGGVDKVANNLLAQIEQLKGQLSYVPEQLKQVQKESDNTNKTIDKSFKRGITSIKRFALSLFSVRSIFAVVSRASSAYMGINDKLSNKIQSVWVGLGAFFAPILEMIANGLLKLIGYINVFVKALTGIDFIARANTKSLQAEAKAVKQLQNSGLDEINTISSDQGAGSGGGAAPKIEIPELDAKTIKKVEDLAKKFKDVYNWVKKNIDIIKTFGMVVGSVFAGIKLTNLLDSLGLANSKSLGLLATLLLVAYSIGSNYDAIKEKIDEAWGELEKFFDNTWTKIEEFGKKFGLIGEGIVLVFRTTFDSFVTQIKGIIDSCMQIMKGFSQLVDGIVSGDFDKILKGLGNIFGGFGNLIIGAAERIAKLAIIPINLLIKGYNKTIGKVAGEIDEITVNFPRIPVLETGTDYVKRSGIALIHEGEAVVTRANNSKYDGIVANNNSVTNLNMTELLNGLARLETAIINKDMNTYLDSTELARNMYSPLEAEKSRQNSFGVIRKYEQ